MENTVHHFILTIKNGYLMPVFCVFFGMKNRGDDNCDRMGYLGENMPFSIMDKMKDKRTKSMTGA